MTREELAEASERLRSAAGEATDETADRLDDLAGQLETLAEREQDPDHGRLARIQNALSDVRGDVSESVRERIDDAKERIREFRKGVEGV